MNNKFIYSKKLFNYFNMLYFLTSSLLAQLNGSFTIPSVTYPTISSIVNDINTNGIDGPVEINILDGTYIESLNFGAILGSSATNTITIQSQSNNAESVIIKYSPTNPNFDNFVMQFSGSQHFIIKNITLETQGSTWARIISLINSTSDLTFKNIIFNGHTEFIPNQFQSIVFGDDSGTLHNISFENNTFNSGFHGLFLYPTNSTNLNVSGNIFNTDHGGIYLQNCFYAEIAGNKLTVNSNIYGMTILSCLFFSIKSNEFNCSQPNISGLSILTCNEGTIVNNFIQMTEHGISLDLSEDIELYFNTINIENNPISISNTSSCIEFVGGNSRITIENNILLNRRDGHSFIGEDGFANVFDYNNLYTSGANFVKWEDNDYNSLSTFQAASSTNLNSFSTNLNFNTTSDLHVTSSYTLLNGINQPSIVTDIDGDIRNNPPFIGADEPKIVSVNVKIMLEGPYTNNLKMSADLTISLPLQQPYSPQIHAGNESVEEDFFNSNTNIVDWVVVELRSDSNTKVQSRAGFLLDTGDVVDLDGSSPLLFFLEPISEYYIAVFQNNHLSIMSANPVLVN